MPIDMAPPSPQVQGFNITPPQYTDPLETLARMQQMRTQGLQQQQAQLGLQQAQLKMASNRAMMDAFVKGGGDVDKTANLMTQSGQVLPDDFIGFQNHITEHKTKLATLRKDQQEILKNDADILAGKYQNVTSQDDLTAVNNSPEVQRMSSELPRITTYPGDPEHMKAVANSIGMMSQITDRAIKGQQLKQEQAATEASQASTKKTGLETAGLVKQQLIADVRAADKDPTRGVPTPEAWQVILKNPAYKDLHLPEQPTQKYLTDLTESTIPEKDIPEYRINQAKAAAIQTLSKMTPQDLEAQVDAIMPPTDPMNAPTKSLVRNAIGRGDFGAVHQILKDAYDQRGRVQVAKETAQNKLNIDISGYARQLGAGMGGGPGGPAADLHGEDYLKTLPAALAARVKNIATGGDVLPTGRAAMSGPGAILSNAVYQYDPEYTPLLAQKRKETLHEFTQTGIQHAGGQALALNTLIHHGDLYQEVGAALKNGTWRPGNAAYNAIASMFGKAPPLQADLVARFLAGETGKVATGGVPGEGEVNGILANLLKDNSPEQFIKAGQTILGIAAGRMVPLKEKVDDAKLQSLVNVLGPSARQILQRRGFDPETMKPVEAGGNTPAVPNSIPQQYRSTAHYSPSQKAWYYSTDGGRTYLKAQ